MAEGKPSEATDEGGDVRGFGSCFIDGFDYCGVIGVDEYGLLGPRTPPKVCCYSTMTKP